VVRPGIAGIRIVLAITTVKANDQPDILVLFFSGGDIYRCIGNFF
jgi:hypothetical protein